MSMFKMKYESYKEIKDLENLINYAVREEKCREAGYGAQGLLKGSPEEMIQQMYDIKRSFSKMNGRQAKHFILSFSKDEEEFIGPQEAMAIGYMVSGYFPEYQIVFGVHTDTDNLHIHFVMNTVSFVTGLKYNINLTDFRMIRRQIEVLVEQFYLCKHKQLFTHVPTMDTLLAPKPIRFPCEGEGVI